MARKIRVLVPTESHAGFLAGLVRDLQAAHSVLVLSADRPSRTLLETFRAEGLDLARLHILDVVSMMDGRAPAERPANTTFLQSPTMLEMMAMRVEQIAGRMQDPHVVVDSLNTLALYNGVPAVQEFSHYLSNRLRTNAIPGDFIIRDNKEGRLLHEKVSGFTDEQAPLPGQS